MPLRVAKRAGRSPWPRIRRREITGASIARWSSRIRAALTVRFGRWICIRNCTTALAIGQRLSPAVPIRNGADVSPRRGLGIIGTARAMGLNVVGRPYDGNSFRKSVLDECETDVSPARRPGECERYTFDAVVAGMEFAAEDCKIRPSEDASRWSTITDNHFAWCIWPGNSQFRAGEAQARKAGLEQCRAEYAAADAKRPRNTSRPRLT